MKNIAVIITVFNRREKTINCLKQLSSIDKRGINMVVYLQNRQKKRRLVFIILRILPARGSGFTVPKYK